MVVLLMEEHLLHICSLFFLQHIINSKSHTFHWFFGNLFLGKIGLNPNWVTDNYNRIKYK